MTMKQLYFILLALMLTCFVNLNEGKRTSSGRRTSSGSSSSYGSSRRVATSAPKYTSKPYSGSSYSAASNTQVKPNYGFTNQAKPQGPPPAYNPVNTAGSRTNIYEKPPGYQQQSYAAKPSYPSNTQQQSSISRTATQKPLLSNNQRPQTQSPLQSSYPRQQYPVNSGIPANARPVNQIPSGAVMVNRPQLNSGYQPSYQPQPIPHTYHHQPAYAAPISYPANTVQTGYYPPGSFPKQSGPGFGTGLGAGVLAGAVGGYLVNSALSSGHRNHYDNNGGGGGGMQKETVIKEIYNSTNTVYVNGAAPGDSGIPPAGNSGTPLAPINSGMPQQGQQQPGQSTDFGPMNPPLIHSPAQPNQSDGNVPLAPLAPLAPFNENDNNNTNSNANATQPPGTYCYEVDAPHPDDPKNITKLVQCYVVPEETQPLSPQSDIATMNNQQLNAGPSQPTTNTESYSITQKTSSVTMSESAKIKQSGAIGKEISIITPILTILLALFLQ